MRSNAAYHSSGRGKLNTDHRAGRMPPAVNRHGVDEKPNCPLSANGLLLLSSRIIHK
jgi:hypothetical protein